MDSVREKIQFLTNLKNNRTDYKNNISIELAEFLKKHKLWYTDKAYKKISQWDKFVNLIRPIASLIFLLAAALHILLHPTEGALDVVMQKTAYLITGFLGLTMQHQSIVCRTEASQVLVALNEMTQVNLRKANHEKYRPRRNLIYLVVLMIPLSTVVLAMSPIPTLVETIRHGELYFKNLLPIHGPPFGLVNYTMAVAYYLVFVYIYCFAMPYFGIVFENFLQIVLNYSILADELRMLRRGQVVNEDEEYEKLRGSMIVFNDLKWCLDLTNKICHVFLMGFVPGVFVNVGLFLALLYSLDSGWDIAINSIYPLYLYSFMAGLCLLGQAVNNSSASLRNAIYECNWYDAPLRFKKMVLLFQIQCERPLTVDLEPFWVLNSELILRIAKTSYIIIAVVRELST